MKKSILLMLSLAALPAFAAEERDWVNYNKYMESLRLDKWHAIPAAERDKVDLYTTVTPKNKAIKPADLALTIVHSGGRQAIPIRADGRVDFPFNPKWTAENPMIKINQPQGEKMEMSFAMNAVIPAGTQWQYAALMSPVAQGNQVIKKLAGMMSMFAPKAEAVVLVFANPAQVKVGAKTLNTDAKNRLRLAPDEALMKENPLVVVSERPLLAKLD